MERRYDVKKAKMKAKQCGNEAKTHGKSKENAEKDKSGDGLVKMERKHGYRSMSVKSGRAPSVCTMEYLPLVL